MVDNLLQNAILHGEEDGQIEINIGNGTYQIRNTYTGTLTTEAARKLLTPYVKEETASGQADMDWGFPLCMRS